jgi:transposase InsO family protein
MTFGLRNAGNTFQRRMDRILSGLDFVFAYLDDIIVASQSVSDHLQHLRVLFQRLQAAGLEINREKCVFGAAAVDFLGHHVSAAGTSPIASNVAAIQRHPQPTTVKELQGFLGVINFYRRFVPSAAKILRPLTDVLRGNPAQSARLEWLPVMAAAFQVAKDALCQTVKLVHPSPGAEIYLMVDASNDHVGAALQQRTASSAPWQHLGFFSKKLEPAQSRYSAFDRELWACFAGIRHFRHMLEGRQFAILTDHKPLTQALHRSSDPWTPRQCRQLDYISYYTSDIRHVAGVDNVVADTLLRPPAVSPPQPPSAAVSVKAPSGSLAAARQGGQSESSPPSIVNLVTAFKGTVDFVDIASNQLLCQSTLTAHRSTSLTLQPVVVGGVSVQCDTSAGTTRPLVPEANRHQVFAAVHGLAHPGTRATRRLLAARFVWRGMNSDISRWIKDCQFCTRGKVTTQPAAAVQPIAVPQRKFTHINVDLVGPLPVAADGSTYLLTVIDRTTHWLEATPLKSIEARTCADALVASWISRYGVPSHLTTDRGRQFTSELWTALCSRLGISHITTTVYHPQANGMVERAHRQLKDALRARLAGGIGLYTFPGFYSAFVRPRKRTAPSRLRSWSLGLL